MSYKQHKKFFKSLIYLKNYEVLTLASSVKYDECNICFEYICRLYISLNRTILSMNYCKSKFDIHAILWKTLAM